MTSKNKIGSIGTLETWRDALINNFHRNNHEVINEDFEIIKKDLDRLEKLEKENSALKSANAALETWSNVYSDNWKAVKERNEKLEKVIEIIKNRYITPEQVLSMEYEVYILDVVYIGILSKAIATLKEWNLLKEVFGCD